MSLKDVQLHLVDSFTECESFLRWLSEDRGRDWLACDLETGGLDWWREPIRLAQFGDTHDGWAIPYDRWGGLIDEVFQRVPPAGRVRYVAHNAKFDREFLTVNRHDPPPFHDSLPMVYLLEPNRPKGLKAAAGRRIDARAGHAQAALDTAMKKSKWTWRTIPADFPPYWQYAALDTVLTACLAEDCWPAVQANFAQAYTDIVESDQVLLRMEMRGMHVDLDYCRAQQARLDARFDQLLNWWEETHHIDPMKGQQLVKFFWEQGIDLPLTTEKGEPSVKKESLEALDHPLVASVLEMRSCQKMSSTYFGNLLEYADSNGKLHPNINPLGAITGRQSITRPALQTLPRKKLVRNAFIPSPGNRLVLADYQGQEMRVFAAFCQDAGMLATYERGEDLHNYAAAQIYGVDFTKVQRQTAKNAGFSKIYGAGVPKFAKTAGITEVEAESFLARYDQLFPQARVFQAAVTGVIITRAREAQSEEGWITTLAGRRVPVPKQKAYVGVNYLVQGSCSDILRRALVDLDNAGIADMGLVLPVHDETAFDVRAEDAEELAHEASKIMAHAALELGVKVPMVVETETVERWGDKYDS